MLRVAPGGVQRFTPPGLTPRAKQAAAPTSTPASTPVTARPKAAAGLRQGAQPAAAAPPGAAGPRVLSYNSVVAPGAPRRAPVPVKEEAVAEEDHEFTTSKPEGPVLENEDWSREFAKKWETAMADPHAEMDMVDPGKKRPRSPPAPPRNQLAKKPKASAPAPSPKAAAAAAAAAAVRWVSARIGTANGKAAATRPRSPTRRADPGGPPPLEQETPMTPGMPLKSCSSSRPSRSLSKPEPKEEHPEWAARCTIEPARPGQPQRLTVSMAEVGCGDQEIATWCSWMERRLAAEQPPESMPLGSRARFKATMIDFSENGLGVNGVKALCTTLEKFGVRCEVLRLTGNNIGNEGARCITKYLMCSSQAVATELHLSRNRITSEGLKWLLGGLALHPAYPVWNPETERFVPLWLRIDHNKVNRSALSSSCESLSCAACLGGRSGDVKCGPTQCVNVGCCDELKHNCVVHLCGAWQKSEDAAPLPSPAAHARPIFAPAGLAAPKAPPSSVEKPFREEPRVVYEDEDLAVVLKPAGWTCQPNPQGVDPAWARLKPLARRQQVGELLMQASPAPLQAWLLLQFGGDSSSDASRDQASDRGIVHRLDVDTSGPLLVGKTLKGYEHARKQIALGILKDYVALVHGTMSVDRGECLAPVDTSTYADTRRVRVDASGQSACTVWEAIAEYESSDRQERFTLVHCRMVTLRTHQLRVHMQYLGHPLVGDQLYGTGAAPGFCPRLFLHKLRIGFFNTSSQACIETCSLQSAPELWRALGRLRKVGGMAKVGCGAPGL